ncbi:MAG: hypothetical protein ABI704_00655 [Kofleriaceae bacterium]
MAVNVAGRSAKRLTTALIRTEPASTSVLRVLDAYDAGATTKDDVLALTKMPRNLSPATVPETSANARGVRP